MILEVDATLSAESKPNVSEVKSGFRIWGNSETASRVVEVEVPKAEGGIGGGGDGGAGGGEAGGSDGGGGGEGPVGYIRAGAKKLEVGGGGGGGGS